MEIVTGYVGRPHVTAEQDRAQNQGVFGVESYVLNVGQKMAAELQSNNEIRIRDGVLVHQGCTGVVKTGTYDPVTITNGTQGMKRIDLIVARYTKNAETNVENLAWKVIQGTPAASNPAIPSYIEGDIQAGDLISDMPMYEIHLDGITVSEVKAVFTALKTGAEMQADISSLNSNLAGLISVEQRGVTLTADWCHIADKSGYYLLAAFNIRSDTNYLVTGIQRPAPGGYTVIISGGTNGTQHALWLIWGKAT